MKKAKANIRYFNFPIQILKGFIKDRETVLNNIFDYAIYEKAQTFKSDLEILRVKEALTYYGFTSVNAQTTLDAGKRLSESTPMNSPKVGLNKDIWIDYQENEKTEFENISLLAFLALKSIIGKKSYCRVVNKYWLARMDGKPKSVNDYNKLSPEIFKYSTEHQTVKIKKVLENSWNLKTYSHYTRGFYVSFTLPIDELVYNAEKRKQLDKGLNLKAKKNNAREKALERLREEFQ